MAPEFTSANIWTEWFPESALRNVLAGQDVIPDIGQVKGVWKKALAPSKTRTREHDMGNEPKTALNASGDRFAINLDNSGEWYAVQLDGVQNNYCGIPALLHAPSRSALIADLSTHYSAA